MFVEWVLHIDYDHDYDHDSDSEEERPKTEGRGQSSEVRDQRSEVGCCLMLRESRRAAFPAGSQGTKMKSVHKPMVRALLAEL